MAKPSRSTISGLTLNSPDVSVAGLLIAKSDVRLFSRSSSSARSSKGATSAASRPYHRPVSVGGNTVDQNQPLRGVITFTIRDTQRSFINCVIWGKDSFVESYNMSFHIGDLVNVMRPSITVRKHMDEYNPMCSSPFLLTINEGTNEILAYRPEGDPSEFRGLFNLTIKPTSAALQLADVDSDNTYIGDDGTMVDLLVAVRTIRPLKTMRSQQYGEGKDRHFATLIVMDQTSPGMRLNIWNQAFVKRSQSWRAMSTVLQLIDVRAAYSRYNSSIELSTHGRTIIIENPKTRETDALNTYMTSVSMADLPSCGIESVANFDVASITTVMTIKQIHDRIESDQNGEEFTAVLYAVIETFDLDGFGKIFARRCAHCKRLMNRHTAEFCQSEDCVILRSESMDTAGSSKNYTDTYDISVDLSDHTGSLQKCHIGAALAKTMLDGHSLEVFGTLSSERRGEIKWKWLLERCTLKMVVKRKSLVRLQSMICIVDCVVAKQSDVLGHIKMY